MSLEVQIRQLKIEKNALILAHYYQVPEILEVADYIGDSLGLSRKAAETSADLIVFAGVKFMAETAKILNPDKKVVIPSLNASCSLDDSCPPKDFKKFLEDYPGHTVVTYVNSSAAVKAMSDVICTSANAVKIVESLPEDKPIVFAPDRNLGRYVEKQTGRNMVLYDASCIVHEAFSDEKIRIIQAVYPDAVLLAHPECEAGLIEKATFTGSTSQMIDYIRNHENSTYIVATEAGILHEMSQSAPKETRLIPAPANEDNSCACSECPFMKENNLENLYEALLLEHNSVEVPEQIRKQAEVPLRRMLEYS